MTNFFEIKGMFFMNVHKNQKHWAPELLTWFYAHRRDLPWRTTPRDPYKVWVSEIMLQQTKVEAVKPYYANWLSHFPTIQTLAKASQDDVLRQWQGLGYYSRARNLHEAVREVEEKYGGRVPSEEKEMLSLKGVGTYTAGAVLSIAYNKPLPAVDGNVLRIFSRLYLIEDNILSAKTKKKITQLVKEQLPADHPGDFNEALMDLGASVCIPKQPHCKACPLHICCLACKEGKEKDLPVRLTKKEIPTEHITVLVVSDGLYWLIHRRPAQGLLASMWEFPNCPGEGEDSLCSMYQELQHRGLTLTEAEGPVCSLRHVFSHKIWQMTVYTADVSCNTFTAKEDWQWLRRDQYTDVPWAGPHGKITAMV